ncbi:hypothetical protein NBRC116493_01770 [Aurantivibrio infirmus]
MFLVYLSGVPPQASAIAGSFENSEGENANELAKLDRETVPKPRFDFYQILKESEVVVNNGPESSTTNNSSPANNSSTARENSSQAAPGYDQPSHEYVLQVGSFKNSEDADRLRAKLILLNLEVKTETVKVRNAEIWHRVLVGPFNSRNTMEKARTTLASQDITSLLTQTR